eukprot:scaffold3777_cov335-Prasinococcus_capsulatus_cf.AAC.1
MGEDGRRTRPGAASSRSRRKRRRRRRRTTCPSSGAAVCAVAACAARARCSSRRTRRGRRRPRCVRACARARAPPSPDRPLPPRRCGCVQLEAAAWDKPLLSAVSALFAAVFLEGLVIATSGTCRARQRRPPACGARDGRGRRGTSRRRRRPAALTMTMMATTMTAPRLLRGCGRDDAQGAGRLRAGVSLPHVRLHAGRLPARLRKLRRRQVPDRQVRWGAAHATARPTRTTRV